MWLKSVQNEFDLKKFHLYNVLDLLISFPTLPDFDKVMYLISSNLCSNLHVENVLKFGKVTNI